MPIGDKQAAVRACVNKVLIDHGAPSPIDANGTMNNTYHYVKTNMYSFHRSVKTCLKSKGYTYSYDEVDAYMDETVKMKVLALYSRISTKTVEMAPAVAAMSIAEPSKKRRRKSARKAVAKRAKKSKRKSARKSGR